MSLCYRVQLNSFLQRHGYIRKKSNYESGAHWVSVMKVYNAKRILLVETTQFGVNKNEADEKSAQNIYNYLISKFGADSSNPDESLAIGTPIIEEPCEISPFVDEETKIDSNDLIHFYHLLKEGKLSLAVCVKEPVGKEVDSLLQKLPHTVVMK